MVVVPVKKKVKALALLSGGLDSTLVVKMMLDQEIELEAISFVTVFCTCTSKGNSCLASQDAARRLGVKLKVFNLSREYLDVVKNPKYGYGRNMNPCIDCRILMFKKAKEYMHQIGASFLLTGEVLGERPMSQRREAMERIEKDAGLSGLVLRPLCALSLEPTIAEEKGWVERSKLLGITGRSRKPQIKLAEELGVTDYPCPAGGCLLTDSGFARKLKDLLETDSFDLDSVQLLKVGRHFRLSPEIKVVVGRDEGENERLEGLVKSDDLIFRAELLPGPLTVVRGVKDFDLEATSGRGGSPENGFFKKAAAITARYSQGRDQKSVSVSFGRKGAEQRNVDVAPADDRALERWRI